MVDLTVINKESLKFLGACKEGTEWFLRNIGELPVNQLNDITGDYKGYVSWLRSNYPISVVDGVCKCIDGSTRVYDNGNMLSYTDSDGRTESYTYDSDGDMVICTDSDGRTDSYTYLKSEDFFIMSKNDKEILRVPLK